MLMKSKNKRRGKIESNPNSVENLNAASVNAKNLTDAAGIKLRMFFEKMSKGVIIFFSGIVLCFLSLTGFVERAFIAQMESERYVIIKHGILFIIMIIISLLLILFVRNIIAKINSKILFFVLLCFYLAAGMYLILNADPNIRSDAKAVYQSAKAFNQGDYSYFDPGGYLDRFPHQLGLVTYERILMIISPNVKFFFTLNLLMVLIINYTQWKISEILSKNNVLTVNYTIIFSFAFLPQLFFVLFLYGLIPGFCCLIAAVYFMLRYFQERNLKDCVFSIVLAAAACALRNNFVIAVIAMCFLYSLDYFRSGRKRCLLVALVTIICVMMLPKGVNIWYRYESGIDFGAGIPKLLWVTMGLQDTGWYNEYTENVSLEYNYNYELARERGIADLQERLDYFRDNPSEALHFFRNKAESTWLDPLFQSTWSGPLEDSGQYMQTQLLSDLYNGKGIYWLLARALNIVLIIIYFMSLLYIIFAIFVKKEGLTCERMFSYIYLLGGFFFHLIWETKSQYVYPYVFMLIPMAALGIELAGDWLFGRLTTICSAKRQNFRRS